MSRPFQDEVHQGCSSIGEYLYLAGSNSFISIQNLEKRLSSGGAFLPLNDAARGKQESIL